MHKRFVHRMKNRQADRQLLRLNHNKKPIYKAIFIALIISISGYSFIKVRKLLFLSGFLR